MLRHIYFHTAETILVGLALLFILTAHFFLASAVYSFFWAFFKRLSASVGLAIYTLVATPVMVLLSISWWLVPSLSGKLFTVLGLSEGWGWGLGTFAAFYLFGGIAMFATGSASVAGVSGFMVTQFGKKRFEDPRFSECVTMAVIKSEVFVALMMLLAQVFALNRMLS